MKKPIWFALASGALAPLGGAAALIIIMPPLNVGLAVGGIAVASGALLGWVVYQVYRLVVGARESIEHGVQVGVKELAGVRDHIVQERRRIEHGVQVVVKNLADASREAHDALVQRVEHIIPKHLQQNAEMLSATLASEWQKVSSSLATEWQKVSSSAQQLTRGAVDEVREHFENILATEREALERNAELRSKEVMSSVTQACAGFERLSAAMNEAVELHTSVVRTTRDSLAHFEKYLDSLAGRERERADSQDAELAKLRDTFVDATKRVEKLIDGSKASLDAAVRKAGDGLRSVIERGEKRHHERERADRDHFQKMLEVQRKAHDEASERSGQLWEHLLGQLQ